jgi:diguanylate cyclase (GGDEF)-like protein/PAS domain S-box-containing protein
MTVHSDPPASPVEAEINRLRSLALLDELTGLPNRRAFLQRLEEAFAQACAGGPAFSLVLLDLDGLKDINDTFGYQAGNRGLQEFAAALAAAVRADDLVARIGGDEFAVLALHLPGADAQAIVERLRDVARGVVRQVRGDGPAVVLSAAVGQGVWHPAGRSVDDLFALAEAELLAAKAAPAAAVEAEGVFRPRGRRALGEELRALLGMARQMTTSTAIGDLLRRITEQAAALVGAEIATIAMVDDDRTLVRFDEVWYVDAWRPHVSIRPLGEGVLGRTAVSGRPEMHNALPADVHYDEATAAALGLRTLLSVPLSDRRGTTFGVLTLGNKRGGQPFVEGDIGLAQAFADLAASAIENVRSFDATEEARTYQRALMEQARDAIVVVDPADGRLLDVNAAMEQLSGYHRTDLLRLTIDELGLAAGHVRRLLDNAALPYPLPVTLTDGIQRKHGTRVPVELSGSYVRTHRGLRLLVIMRDIEERLLAEAETRRRTEELEARNAVAGLLTESRSVEAALAGVLPIMMKADEVDGALVLLTETAGRLHPVASAGLPAELMRMLDTRPPRMGRVAGGQVVVDRVPFVINDLERYEETLWREIRGFGFASLAVLPLVANDRVLGVLATGSARSGMFDEPRLTRLRAFADQIAVWLEGRFSLEAAQTGEQDARLIADLGESLNESRDEAEILRRLADGVAGALGGGVIVLLRDVVRDRWHAAATAHANPERQQALDHLVALEPWASDGVPHAILADRVRPQLFNFIDGDQPDSERLGEFVRLFNVGSLILVPMTAGDDVIGLFVAANGRRQPPLSERHLALAQQIVQHATAAVANARAYRESLETRDYLQAVMRHAGDGIVVTDADSRLIVDANDRFCELLGYSRDQVIGMPALALIAPEQREEVERSVPFAGRRGGAVQRLLMRSDGRQIPVEVSNSRVGVGGRDLIVGVVRDLRDRIEAERQVRFQARVLATMRDAVVALDRDGRVVVWNRGAEELFGWTEAEMIGAAARDSVTAGGLPRLNELVHRLATEPAASGEVPFERKDGSRMWCHVTLTRMEDERGNAAGLIGIIRDVTAEHAARAARNRLLRRLTEANEASKRRAAELSAIADVAGILVAGGEPDALFAGVADRILRSGMFDLATISLYDADRGALCLRQVQHRLPDQPTALLSQQDRWIEQSRLPLLERLLAQCSPLVFHDGDELWRASAVAQWITREDRLRLGVVMPLLYNGAFIGALILCAREDRQVPPDELRLLQALADQLAAAVHAALDADLIRTMRRDALLRLAQVCEARDAESAAHLRRIQTLTEALCRELLLPEEEEAEISLASVLHDIGMIGLPEHRFDAGAPRTAAERDAIRLHPITGEALLAGPAFYATARQIVRSHHERWDGSGYPDGLAGHAIPRPARIVAVADVYDALTSPHASRPAWSGDQAAEYIVDHAGILFDPEVVAAFERVWRRVS